MSDTPDIPAIRRSLKIKTGVVKRWLISLVSRILVDRIYNLFSFSLAKEHGLYQKEVVAQKVKLDKTVAAGEDLEDWEWKQKNEVCVHVH